MLWAGLPGVELPLECSRESLGQTNWAEWGHRRDSRKRKTLTLTVLWFSWPSRSKAGVKKKKNQGNCKPCAKRSDGTTAEAKMLRKSSLFRISWMRQIQHKWLRSIQSVKRKKHGISLSLTWVLSLTFSSFHFSHLLLFYIHFFDQDSSLCLPRPKNIRFIEHLHLEEHTDPSNSTPPNPNSL